MKRLLAALQQGKKIRVLGIDDAPFNKHQDDKVNVVACICSNTRFEGMLWLEATRDGTDATDVIIQGIKNSKFHNQLHAILLDGIAIGGFNIIDLPRLSDALQLPCLAVMRKPPDGMAIDNALRHFTDYENRIALIQKAGAIYQMQGFVFQVAGCDELNAERLLQQVTDTGKVPEALRIAHLIAAAIKYGESSQRA